MNKHSRLGYTKLVVPVVSFALCGLVLSGCSSSDNPATVTAPPSSEGLAKDTVVSLQVLDASGDTVSGATVELTVVDANATNPVDPSDVILASQESQQTDETGLIAYEPNVSSLNDGSKTIQVRASKDGYLSNNLPITITAGEVVNDEIVITKIPTGGVDDEVVEGITATSEKDIDITTTPVTVSTPVVSVAGEPAVSKTNITIQEDPGAVAADGVTRLSNKIEVVVAQFDSDVEGSLDAFPGGLSVSIENPDELAVSGPTSVDNNETSSEGDVSDGEVVFESAGFTAIEVRDENGNVAKTFEKPITVKTKVDGTIVNPDTEELMAVGDRIPIWSFEASTGKWSYDQIGTVQSDGSGGLEVVYDITHLSYYNLDFHYGRKCNTNLTFVNNDGGANPSMNVRLRKVTGGRFNGWTRTRPYPGDAVLTLANAPAFAVNMSLTDVNGDPITINSIDGNEPGPVRLCSNGAQHTINFTPTVIEYAEVEATASVYCSNDSAVADTPVQGSNVWIYRKMNGWYRYLQYGRTDVNGSSSFSLPLGDYRVRIRDYDPTTGYKYLTQDLTLDTESETKNVALRIPKVCDITTGGTGTGG